MPNKPWFQANIHAPGTGLALLVIAFCLFDSDHPFGDLCPYPKGWLGSTVVSGESQVLQGRLISSTF